jgi:hypothetical protein
VCLCTSPTPPPAPFGSALQYKWDVAIATAAAATSAASAAANATNAVNTSRDAGMAVLKANLEAVSAQDVALDKASETFMEDLSGYLAAAVKAADSQQEASEKAAAAKVTQAWKAYHDSKSEAAASCKLAIEAVGIAEDFGNAAEKSAEVAARANECVHARSCM